MSSKLVMQLIFVMVVIIMRIISPSTANVSYLLVAVYAISGRAQAIQALALSWLFAMISPGIGASEVPLASIGRYLILACAALSVGMRNWNRLKTRGFKIAPPVLLTLLLGVGFVVHSILFSPIRDVSVLKAMTWAISFSTIFSAWRGLTQEEKIQLESQLFAGLILILLISLPFLGAGIGYLRNDRGFQGVLNHPQAFGPVMALLAAWLGGRIFAERYPPWRIVVLLALALMLIVLSGARTAGLGLFLGLGISLIVGRWMSRKRWREFLPGLFSPRVQLILATLVVAVGFSAPLIGTQIAGYLSKGTENTAVIDAYDGSRGFLINRMWENIQKNPLQGLGFGIASDPESMEISRDPVLGLPTGASIEKGVVFLAIWEEVGLIGLVAVLMWVWMLVRRAADGGGVAALAVFLTAIFMNFGESTLFSPGGFGMLPLILIGWATSGRARGSRGVVNV